MNMRCGDRQHARRRRDMSRVVLLLTCVLLAAMCAMSGQTKGVANSNKSSEQTDARDRMNK